MITREEAVALASVPLVDPLGAYARTVVALYDERDKAPDRRLLAAIDDINDEVEMAHRARLRAEQERDVVAAMLASERDLSAKLEMELRRLRAAEAPGTDDAAFEGTGWKVQSDRRSWLYDGKSPVWPEDRWRCWVDGRSAPFLFALDAMRAAAPGAV